jgi:hypothetical protein
VEEMGPLKDASCPPSLLSIQQYFVTAMKINTVHQPLPTCLSPWLCTLAARGCTQSRYAKVTMQPRPILAAPPQVLWWLWPVGP